MTLNGVIAHNFVILSNSIALQADYVTVVEVVEDRPIMSAKYRFLTDPHSSRMVSFRQLSFLLYLHRCSGCFTNSRDISVGKLTTRMPQNHARFAAEAVADYDDLQSFVLVVHPSSVPRSAVNLAVFYG